MKHLALGLGLAVACVHWGACDVSRREGGSSNQTPGASAGAQTHDAQPQAPEFDLLQRINALRLAGTRCGAEAMASVSPVIGSDPLQTLAREHAEDMATRGYFSHVSPDGLGPGERARRQGYVGKVSENLAWGQSTAEGALAAWRDSAEHCRSIMDPGHRAVGLARVVGNRKVLWVAVFGSRIGSAARGVHPSSQ